MSAEFVIEMFFKQILLKKSFLRSSSLQSRLLSSMIPTNIPKQTVAAVVQLNCKADKNDNFNRASSIIKTAKSYGASMAFLPECFDMLCESKQDTFANMEPIDGPLIKKYQELASQQSIWLSLGGLHEKVEGEEKAKNAHIVIDNHGKIVDVYRKIHLFNLEIPGVVRLIESDFSIPGDKLVLSQGSPVGTIGLGICYDVRFPEMAICYASSGADVLTYPSSFTVTTGMDHWSTLLRSRAIENQCYVIAAAQTGVHNKKRSSFGHAMIVDPWGAVIAQCSEGEGFALGVIDPEVVKTARQKLPIWSDRRIDVYGALKPIPPPKSDSNSIDSVEEYTFGSAKVKPLQVFFKSQYSFAFVNHRPVLPGHVLVASLRPQVKRVKDLSPPELTDYFSVVQKVQSVIEKIHSTESSTIAIQDGIDAGQSIEQLHAHILPRKATDFGGNIDRIYKELETHDKKEGEKRHRLLSDQEMRDLALGLRSHF